MNIGARSLRAHYSSLRRSVPKSRSRSNRPSLCVAQLNPMTDKQIKFNRGRKFDLQLSAALVNERRLAEIFSAAKIEKIELKSESWLWERTKNICIEYRQNGQP